jgi:glutamine amidotransferase
VICIINYGVGNLTAIHNMLRRIGVASVVSSDPKAILEATKLILPGVGAFDAGINSLRERGLPDVLNTAVMERRTPLLGICLGMQLLGAGSDEGIEQGLGWIPMHFKKLESDGKTGLKSLHMGWNVVKATRAESLLGGYEAPPRFYFVHRYYAVCKDPRDILGTTEYGLSFPVVVGRDNVLGVQFHPEKSHKFGMQLLQNFAQAV